MRRHACGNVFYRTPADQHGPDYTRVGIRPRLVELNSRLRKLTVDIRQQLAYVPPFVIRSFKNKGLAELWEKGSTAKIDTKLQARILRRLDRLDVIVRPEEMNVPGFDFHPLRGFRPMRYSVHVNGPWCITFEFEDGDACRVDFEQYH